MTDGATERYLGGILRLPVAAATSAQDDGGYDERL